MLTIPIAKRLEIVDGFAQRMVAAEGSPFRVHLTTNQREAIAGAGYVITQLRVGWMQARHDMAELAESGALLVNRPGLILIDHSGCLTLFNPPPVALLGQFAQLYARRILINYLSRL